MANRVSAWISIGGTVSAAFYSEGRRPRGTYHSRRIARPDAAMEAFETLPGFNRQWRDAVVFPPFATNRTVVYDRAARA